MEEDGDRHWASSTFPLAATTTNLFLFLQGANFVFLFFDVSLHDNELLAHDPILTLHRQHMHNYNNQPTCDDIGNRAEAR